MTNRKDYIAAAIAWHSQHIATFQGAHPLSAIENTIEASFGVAFDRQFFEQALEYVESMGWIERFDDPFTEPFFSFDPSRIAEDYRKSNNRESAIYRARELGRDWLISALVGLAQGITEDIEDGAEFVPAADRKVRFDDNMRERTQASLDQIVAEIDASNSATEELGDEKDRIVAEITAGKRLIESSSVRVKALAEVLLKPLRYLAEKFSEGAIGALAAALIVELLKVI